MKKSTTLVVVILISVNATYAQSYRGVGTPPTILSLLPANNATNVSTNANIIITFDEFVSLALDSKSPLTDNSIIIDCTISGVQSYPQVDTDDVIVADINFNDFSPGDECTITVSAFWVHDQDDGNHFDGNGDGFASPVDDDYVSTFNVATNTGTTDTPPIVTMITPADMSTNIPIDAMVTLVFNEAVDIPVNAITINCTESGTQSFPDVLLTPVTTININPESFISGETCNLTASTLLIHDTDGFPDHLDGNGDGVANGDDFESFFIIQDNSDLIIFNSFE